MSIPIPFRHEGNIVLVTRDAVGESTTLGHRLMQNLLASIAADDRPPRQIFFVNRGVFLTCGPDPVDAIDSLRELEAKGVEIYSCRTCLEHFNLTQALLVGSIGNLSTAQTLMSGAAVVTL